MEDIGKNRTLDDRAVTTLSKYKTLSGVVCNRSICYQNRACGIYSAIVHSSIAETVGVKKTTLRFDITRRAAHNPNCAYIVYSPLML